MTDRLQKQDVVHRLAQRMGTEERTAAVWLDALTETLYDAFKEGRSVTLPGFGGFDVRPHRAAWAFKFREYCLSNDILLSFPIVFVVTRAIGGKYGRMSEMHASAPGQGREGQGHTALALSGLWLSIYAHHAAWETRVAEVAGCVPLLSRPLHERVGEDVRRPCELRAEMDPALCHGTRG